MKLNQATSGGIPHAQLRRPSPLASWCRACQWGENFLVVLPGRFGTRKPGIPVMGWFGKRIMFSHVTTQCTDIAMHTIINRVNRAQHRLPNLVRAWPEFRNTGRWTRNISMQSMKQIRCNGWTHHPKHDDHYMAISFLTSNMGVCLQTSIYWILKLLSQGV